MIYNRLLILLLLAAAALGAAEDALRLGINLRWGPGDAATLGERFRKARALGIREVDDAPPGTGGRSGPAKKRSGKTDGDRSPFRRFVSNSGHPIWVGRSARENDALTLHHAKPYHVWLHVEGRAGSHVIIPLIRGAELPSDLLVAAAHLPAPRFAANVATVCTWSDRGDTPDPLPEVPVAGPLTHVTQAVGPGFVLLHFGAPPAEDVASGLRVVPVLAQADARWPQALLDTDARMARAFDAPPGSAYLLRPDGHVAARWKQAAAPAVRAALQRALGHGHAAPTATPEPAGAGSARDRLYTRLALGVSEAGQSRETLFLARLALLLCERLDDEAAAGAAITAALHQLPEPSLSAPDATY